MGFQGLQMLHGIEAQGIPNSVNLKVHCNLCVQVLAVLQDSWLAPCRASGSACATSTNIGSMLGRNTSLCGRLCTSFCALHFPSPPRWRPAHAHGCACSLSHVLSGGHRSESSFVSAQIQRMCGGWCVTSLPTKRRGTTWTSAVSASQVGGRHLPGQS